MAGMRPVAEMQYGDFVFCAMDQVVNQAAKMHYMSNGPVRVPMVLRLPGRRLEARRAARPVSEAWFLHTPGLKVACPANPYDAKGMLMAAIRDDNPVDLPRAQAPLRRQGRPQGEARRSIRRWTFPKATMRSRWGPSRSAARGAT